MGTVKQIYSGKDTSASCAHAWTLRAKVKELGNKVAIHYCAKCPGTRVINDTPFEDATVFQKVKDLGYEVD